MGDLSPTVGGGGGCSFIETHREGYNKVSFTPQIFYLLDNSCFEKGSSFNMQNVLFLFFIYVFLILFCDVLDFQLLQRRTLKACK